jgi:GNAT superfamily N-acetyltransferase
VIAAQPPVAEPQPRIIPAQRTDTPLVAAVIGSAFQHLDVARWLIADDHDREPVLTANMQIWIEHAFDTGGVVDMTADHAGVAVWFINDGNPDGAVGNAGDLPRDYDERLDEACGAYADRFRLLDQAFAANHPHGVPHHHLAFMAVTPESQDNGYGNALLEHHYAQHPQADSYLEASCADSRRLYLRHGFHDLSDPFTLPWDGPPMWPMWRPHDNPPEQSPPPR